MASTRDIYRLLHRLLSAGHRGATATVLAVRGSVPREVGAKMLLDDLGRTLGTVGGGCGEADALRAAARALQTHRAETIKVDLTEEITLDSDAVCGGILDVRIEPWSEEELPLLASLLTATEHDRPAALLSRIHSDRTIREVLDPAHREELSPEWQPFRDEAMRAIEDGRSRLVTASDAPLFVEVMGTTDHLIIVGAGHIAQPLCRIGKLLGLRVTVLDDRRQYANPERFPEADEVRAEPFLPALKDLSIDASTHIVLVTRGHQQDLDCLLAVLDRPAAYLGMIGSRRRVGGVFQLLTQERGIPAEKLERVHAPIGLDLGAQTPEEIALAIAAEILAIRRGGSGQPLSQLRRA